MFLRGFIHQGKQDYYKKRDALSLRRWIVYRWGLMPSGKFSFIWHIGLICILAHIILVQFFFFFYFLHINIISHTHEFHTKVYFHHFFGRYFLAFTRKSCCFFTDLQVCVTIQLTFDQWIRLKTLSADFLSNFNISQGGKGETIAIKSQRTAGTTRL